MKLTFYLFLTGLTFWISSCRDNIYNARIEDVYDSTILDTSKLISDTNNLQVNKIDTFKYSNLPYWDSTIDRFSSAYIDTFSVDGNRFRFINPATGKQKLDILVYLEKLINSNWVFTGFTVKTMNRIGDYFHSRDVNGDGFIDITQDERFVQAVYFYDPKTKSFPGTTDPYNLKTNFINPEWELIDTTRKIFCDFQMFKGMCGQVHSHLYTYNGTVRQNLYDLELFNCSKTNNNTDTITKLILYKPKDNNVEYGQKISETFLTKPFVLGDDSLKFDYKKYWLTNYKNTLGYR